MASKGYKKAQQVWSETEFVFARKVGFNEAFPSVKEVRLQLVKTNYFRPIGMSIIRTMSSWQKFVDCTNLSCRDGGIDVGAILRDMMSKGETTRSVNQPCRGGEYIGKRFYRSCMHGFKGEMTVVYKEPESAKEEQAEDE